ncbi:MAG: hypothetical protein QM783_08645 [Phycisphaerales bacterium]
MADAQQPPRTPMGDLIPPRVVATPGDIQPAPEDAVIPDFHTILSGDVPFWRPSPLQTLKYIGWRWIIFAPAIIFVLAPVVLLIFRPGIVLGTLAWSIKLWVMACAWCIYLFVRAVKRGVKDRPGVFCIHCGYTLEGLGDSGRCPECGRLFVRSLSEEYKKDPHFFMERHKAMRSHPKNVGFAAGDAEPISDGTS